MAEEQPRSEAEKERTTALARVPMGSKGVMLQGMHDLKEFAETAVKSGSAPKHMGVGQAMMAVQAGLERGLGPLGGLQACVIINGVLSWRGWAAKGLIQQSGLLVPGTLRSWHEGELVGRDANAIGYCSAQRKGYKEAVVRTFSVHDAKVAGLWNKGGPWQTRPGNMLEWRAIGDMARFEFPEILGGIPIADEVEGGYGPTTVEVEGPQERAHRPAPKLTDPLLVDVVAGDATGIAPEPEKPSAGEQEAEVVQPAKKRRGEKAPEAAPPEPAQVSHASPVAPPEPEEKPTTRGKATPCPRCGEEDSGYALLGECGVCNYPEPEPGKAG